MIKIYILKVFFYILGNYHELKHYKFYNCYIDFFKEFEYRFEDKKETLLSYYMLPNGDIKKWKHQSEKKTTIR
jgi:hypothetical protein